MTHNWPWLVVLAPLWLPILFLVVFLALLVILYKMVMK